MLVCNVSLRPPRSAIAAEVAEAAMAVDAAFTGQVVFATLVDDPASVSEFVDAYLGEIMLEAALAAEVTDGSTGATSPAGVTTALVVDERSPVFVTPAASSISILQSGTVLTVP